MNWRYIHKILSTKVEGMRTSTKTSFHPKVECFARVFPTNTPHNLATELETRAYKAIFASDLADIQTIANQRKKSRLQHNRKSNTC